MKREDFFKEMISTFENNKNIKEQDKLMDIEDWDSLNVLNVLSLFNKHFNITVNLDKMSECQTLKDILDLGNEYFE